MTVMLRIPSSLEHWLDGKTEFACEGKTVFDCIENLNEKFPVIKSHLYNQEGELSNIMIFRNGDNIRNLEGLETPVNDGDEISMIPLVAGG